MILIDENRVTFRPGELLRGEVRWQEQALTEIRLIWYTSGKGTTDTQVVQTIPGSGTIGSCRFEFRLPDSPPSFSGRLISLHWAVEAVSGSQTMRHEITLSPTGREILLPEPPKK